MVHPVLDVHHTGVVPVVEGEHHEHVPPLVRVTNEVKLSSTPSFRDFEQVNGERNPTDDIHSNDTGEQQLKHKQNNYYAIKTRKCRLLPSACRKPLKSF